MSAPLPAQKDPQSVSPDGKRLSTLIQDVKVRDAITHPDDRGDLCEIYNPAWGFGGGELTYVYTSTVYPQKVKGWVKHLLQCDRLFFLSGSFRVVLYDDREESSTYRMLNELYFSDRKRGLLLIPPGVFHAVQNVGSEPSIFINCPSHPYDHANPDKYRLPLKNDLIPYSFQPTLGG